MLKFKSLISVLLILTILFCLHPINSSIAGDCDTKGSGAGTPTVIGNYNYAPDHVCTEDPDLEYDTVNSNETIDRNGSAALVVIGNNAPFTWSVSNQGFWLDADHTVKTLETEGLTATLYADGTACGTVVIKVTGCDGQEVTGYVRCTAGTWVHISSCNEQNPGCSGWFCAVNWIDGIYKYDTLWHTCDTAISPDCCDEIPECGDCGCGVTDDYNALCAAGWGPCVGPACSTACRCMYKKTYEWKCF